MRAGVPRLWLWLALAAFALLLAGLWHLGTDRDASMVARASAAAPSAPHERGAELREPDQVRQDVDETRLGAPLRTEVEPQTVAAPTALTVNVIDRDSGLHLSDIELWRSDGPIERGLVRARMKVHVDFGPRGFSPGPSGSDELLQARLASPFRLELDERTPRGLWILAPGGVPYRYVLPERPTRDELWVALERACGLEVRWNGAAPSETTCVRLYRTPFGPARFDDRPDAERTARAPVRFEGLEPGAWTVTLEEPLDGRKLFAVLASARVELARGEWRSVVLEARDVDAALKPALLTLRLPSRWSAESGARASLEPSSGNPARLDKQRSHDSGDPLQWGPIGLVPGTWSLRLSPGRIALPIELAPGERRALDVPWFDLVDASITILEADGAPAQLERVGWRATLDWIGAPASSSRAWFETVAADAPLRLRAPALVLELMYMRRGGDSGMLVADLRAGREVVLRLPASTLLSIGIDGLDEFVDLEWLARVRIRCGGVDVPSTSLGLSEEDGRARGRIRLERAGTLDVEFPPLRSQGSLRARRVTLVEGETLRLDLGTADLLGAPSAGR